MYKIVLLLFQNLSYIYNSPGPPGFLAALEGLPALYQTWSIRTEALEKLSNLLRWKAFAFNVLVLAKCTYLVY